jgi:hypothetical protein
LFLQVFTVRLKEKDCRHRQRGDAENQERQHKSILQALKLLLPIEPKHRKGVTLVALTRAESTNELSE